MAMLNKLIGHLRFNKAKKATSQVISPDVIPLSRFHFSREAISHAALHVAKVLQDKGFKAFIVGGAVRDLILSEQPKDFDIVTDAFPEQVKRLFKRAQKIGRRFPIVHVYFERELVEVSTFRQKSATFNEQGRIIRDNCYGTIDMDAARRDFTCNALYLDPIAGNVHCYHHALNHLKDKKLILIGDPEVRFKEDPIRILRGIRISSKLNLNIDDQLIQTMQKHAHLIDNEPISRRFDELAKIIYSKHAYTCFTVLINTGLLSFVHPITQILLTYSQHSWILINRMLQKTDTRLQSNQHISLGFVIAAFLWPMTKTLWQQYMKEGLSPSHAMQQCLTDIYRQPIRQHIQQKIITTINEIWRLQNCLQHVKTKKQIDKITGHLYFRAAYDFFLLRAESEDVDQSLAHSWQQLVEKNNFAPLLATLSSTKNAKQRCRALLVH
jgi:poly(A) polymerase